MKYMYILYQYLIALPIFVVITMLTAIITILCVPWKNSEPIHKIQQLWSRSFFWLLFVKVEIEGVENIPQGQSLVFVCNHQSMADVFLVYGWLPVIFKWIMKQELRRVPFVGTACKCAGHIFIDRKHRRAAAESIQQAEKILHDGVCVVVFPEGTRTTDGTLGRFKRGAVQIAFDLHLPVVPIALTGCYELWPRQKAYATRHAVKLHIGQPIHLQDYTADNQQEAVELLREKVSELM